MPFRYTSPTGRKFAAPRRLSDPELEELFKEDTPPLSAKPDKSREVGMLGAIPISDKYKPTAIRVVGMVTSAMAGFPFIGGAVSELAAEGAEEALGYRQRINPKEVAVGAIANKFAPGLE